MSSNGRLTWKSGLARTPISEGWALDLDSRDPEIPNLPLETQPLKILEPAIAAKVAGAFWKMAGCNELADAHDFETVTRRINGGLNGLEERKVYWEKLKAIL